MPDKNLEDSQIAVSIKGVDDELLLRSFKGTEEVGRLFEFEMEILCGNHTLKHLDVLGRNATVSVHVPDSEPRFFNGHITRFTYAGTHSRHGTEGGVGTYGLYVATLRPWLWFLTLRSDCRIYQAKTVPEIIEETFERHGFSDYQLNLTAQYKPWEYCVQYRETDADFITRLMEHEGIYFYYEHTDGKHVVVLCDGDGLSDARPAAPGYEEIPYQSYHPRVESVFKWSVSQQIGTGAVGLKDFDFTAPRSSLSADVIAHDSMLPESVLSKANLEAFEYPGKYIVTQSGALAPGEQYAHMRMEELEAQYEAGNGETTARMLAVGGLFRMTGHPRTDENRQYMVLSATWELHWGAEAVWEEEPPPVFMCQFRAMDASRRYRLPRTTPRPTVRGPQTAIVVGPEGEKVAKGEKIYTDQYGRVMVKFHWDRYEVSSCWIRVSQAWAGSNWGGMHIPHIGQEVIVEFLEGDPDRPLITGRVYNAVNMPPLDLPANKHKSMLGDDYGNRIVFDATPGDEHVALYSPHHDSALILGRSRVSKTDSDSGEMYLGDKTELMAGAATSTTIGSTTEGFIGFSTGIKIGSSIDAFAGASLGLTYGPNYQFNETDTVRHAEKDWLQAVSGDAIIDCEGEDGQKLILCSGANRGSLVAMEDETLTIAVGKGERAPSLSADTAKSMMKAAIAIAGVTQLTSSISAAVRYGNYASSKPNWAKEDVEGTDRGWAIGTHTAAVVAHLITWVAMVKMYATTLKPDEIKKEVEKHKPAASLEMTASGDADLTSTNEMNIGGDEKVDIGSTKGNIWLTAKKNVDIRAHKFIANHHLKVLR